MEEKIKILNKIKGNKKEIKNFGVKRIGLFGSVVRGKQKKNSDIDFIVSFEKITFDNYFLLLRFFEKMFKKKIDLVIESDLKPELNYIKKEAEYVEI
ncbi:MAG: nucleotidyltransferase domain-containing protein [Nanoarchaeota archaeon]